MTWCSSTTPLRRERLARLVVAAREQLADEPPLPALAASLGATQAEAKDVAQALGKAVAFYWPARGWRCRLRSDREMHLLAAANDNFKVRQAA